MTAARDYMGRIAELPCLICLFRLGLRTHPVEVHHPTVPARDWLTVPLCARHHRGVDGVHGLSRRGFDRRWKVSDADLWEWTNELLHKETRR